jgi:SAM-dependent methyltransferase
MKMPLPTISEERPCPTCGSRTYAKFANKRIADERFNEFTFASRKQPEFMCFRLVRCKRCDLVYTPNPPSKEFLESAYSSASYDSQVEAQAAAKSYAYALSPYISRFSEERGAAVDVGAGNGALLPWLLKQGFKPVIGIEPSPAAIQAALPEIAPLIQCGMFSETLLNNIHPTLICSFMTLEHISDPKAFASNAFKALQPGGMIAIIVHNWRAPFNRLLGLRSPIIDVEHLQLYSSNSIDSLLKQAGFQAIQRTSFVNTYPLDYWLKLSPLPTSLKHIIVLLLKRLSLAKRPLSMPVGNMLAIGIKP